MKRTAAVILTFLALMALAAFTQSGPPCGQGYRKNEACAPGVTVTLNTAGTVIWVKYTISAAPSDSLTVDLSATGQSSAHRVYTADSKTDSTSYPKPAPGASISGTVLGKNWRKITVNGALVDRFAAAPPAAWGPYTEPDTTVSPPAVTVTVFPQVSTISTSDSLTLTARVS